MTEDSANPPTDARTPLRERLRASLFPGGRKWARNPLWIAIAGGVVFALSSPPTDLYPAVVVGMALLAVAIADAPTAKAAFGRTVAWGTAAQLVGMRFVPAVIARFTPLPLAAGILALALLSAAQSVTWAIGMAVASTLARRLRAPLELAFACGVMVALSMPSVFAWSPAGLVTPWPAFVQLADVIGERGVSVLFAALAALLARAWLERRERLRGFRVPILATGAAALLFGLLAVHGTLRMHAVQRALEGLPTVRVGLVDQAVAPLDRWDPKNHADILRTLRRLTRDAEARGAELTVWSEGAYPYELDHEHLVQPKGAFAILGRDLHGPVLVGLITAGPSVALEDGTRERRSFNSATLLGTDGVMEPTADKLQLLWFGETVPGGEQLPWLRRLFQRSGGLVPGAGPRALTLDADGERPALRMAVLNCYEDTLTDVGRRMNATLRPNLLVNITNDAWFYDTAESELHARLGAMRAIEARRDVVRAVNLGVMTWVDAAGVTRARYADSAPGSILVQPSVSDGPTTAYVDYGDVPILVLLAACLALSAYLVRKTARP